MKILILIFTALISLSAIAQEEDFRRGNARDVDNKDSVVTGAIQMELPEYGGTGCPQGSISSTLSPDGKILSVIYDEFILEVGEDVGAKKGDLNCHLKIPIKVPEGIRATVVALDYRGYYYLPELARARLKSKFYFQTESHEKRKSGVTTRNLNLVGPLEKDYTVSSVIRKNRHLSECGQDFTLNVINNIKGTAKGESALITVDSLDAIGRADGRTKIKYHLKWKRCRPERIRKKSAGNQKQEKKRERRRFI